MSKKHKKLLIIFAICAGLWLIFVNSELSLRLHINIINKKLDYNTPDDNEWYQTSLAYNYDTLHIISSKIMENKDFPKVFSVLKAMLPSDSNFLFDIHLLDKNENLLKSIPVKWKHIKVHSDGFIMDIPINNLSPKQIKQIHNVEIINKEEFSDTQNYLNYMAEQIL